MELCQFVAVEVFSKSRLFDRIRLKVRRFKQHWFMTGRWSKAYFGEYL